LRKAAKFRWVQIQGGEPILYKELERLVTYLVTSDLVPRFLMPNQILPKFRIATNAMLILNEDQLRLFKEHSVEVRLSDCGLEHQKIDQIVEQCRANKIPYRVHRQITKKNPG